MTDYTKVALAGITAVVLLSLFGLSQHAYLQAKCIEARGSWDSTKGCQIK